MIQILVLPVLICACSTGRIDRFETVDVGMTREEVRGVLGSPSSTFTRQVDATGTVQRLERWQYGDTPGTLATGVFFSEHPSQRVWSIFFDENGRVIEISEPDWSESPSPNLAPNPIPPRNR